MLQGATENLLQIIQMDSYLITQKFFQLDAFRAPRSPSATFCLSDGTHDKAGEKYPPTHHLCTQKGGACNRQRREGGSKGEEGVRFAFQVLLSLANHSSFPILLLYVHAAVLQLGEKRRGSEDGINIDKDLLVLSVCFPF